MAGAKTWAVLKGLVALGNFKTVSKDCQWNLPPCRRYQVSETDAVKLVRFPAVQDGSTFRTVFSFEFYLKIIF